MAEHIDNPPAFPVEIGEDPEGKGYHQNGNYSAQFHGMTLRDYFAAKAYDIADAMLKARMKP